MSLYQVATFRLDVDEVDFRGIQSVPYLNVALISRDRFILNWGERDVPDYLKRALLAYMFGARYTAVPDYSLLDVLHFLRFENEDLSLFHYIPGTTDYRIVFDFEGPIGMYISAFHFGRFPAPS